LKADIEQAQGNVQPILVRPLKDELDQFEIVFGHRRHRASLELGIPVLASIWVDELGDAALFAAMDRENRERADLSSYEQGVMYQRALEEQLFPTQRQLAEALGVSHTWVRKALMVAQLPQAVVDCFRSPLDITFRHADRINTAIEKDRRGVLKRVEKVRGLSLASAMVVERLLDSKTGFERTEKIELQIAGEKCGVLTRSKTGEITISITAEMAAKASQNTLEETITEALRKLRGFEPKDE
jgi:ParB family chromosome partitioning protein